MKPGERCMSDSQHPSTGRILLSRVLAMLAVLALGALSQACGGKAGEPTAEAPKSAGAETEEASKVGPGSVVILDAEALRLAGIELAAAVAPGASGLVANGTVAYDANRVSIVAPRAEGRVTAVRADLGQAVRPGDVLAILESSDVGETRGQVARSSAGLEVAKQAYERERSLYEQHVSSQKEMLEAKAVYLSAQADYEAATARARALGASVGAGAAFPLASPLAGTVVERHATPGQIAGPETPLFTIADLRDLWIEVDVYEADADRVRNGASAAVTTRAIPGETFMGRVTYAGGIVDAASRTVKVRVEVDNRQGRLRPGMYAEARIEAPSGGASAKDAELVAVPEIAVQDLAGQTVVFVPGEPAGHFIARAVSVGSRLEGGLVIVTKGIRTGERIVVQGAFQLKSELLKASFGDDD